MSPRAAFLMRQLNSMDRTRVCGEDRSSGYARFTIDLVKRGLSIHLTLLVSTVHRPSSGRQANN